VRPILKTLALMAAFTAFGIATPGQAQEAAGEKPTTAHLAEASAEADALISGTGLPDLFVNVSRDGMVRIRHKVSGLVCSYLPGAQNNSLMVFDQGDGQPGDDVGCNADFGEVFLTYYATRYGPGYSAADSARDAANAIRNRWPDARPYEGAMAVVEPPAGVTESEYAALLIGPEASPRYAHALTAKVGEWIFKQRMTGDGDQQSIMSNQIVAGAFFNDVLQAAVGEKP
jgi:hypothetical protein